MNRAEATKKTLELANMSKPSVETTKLSAISLSPEIYSELKQILKRYLDTSEENYQVLALWTLGTYFHSQFETYPILQIYAQKRSGKTRTLKLLSSLAHKSDGTVSTSPTETSLFRHKEGAMFFDEMESISSKERAAFRETLNAIYKKGNKIIRYREKKIDGEYQFVEEAFYPYYPIGLANISGLNDVLADRAVQLIFRRSKKNLTKLIEDFSKYPQILKLKDKLARLDADIPLNFFSDWNCFVEGKPISDELLRPLFEKIDSSGISSRSLEIFFPLIVLSNLCDEVDNFIKTAKNFCENRENDEGVADIDERLKSFISKNYEGRTEFIPLNEILQSFRATLENPEEWVNPKWLGNSLKRLDLIRGKRLHDGRTQVRLLVDLVEVVDVVEQKDHREENPKNPKDSKESNPTSTKSTSSTTSTTSTTSTKNEVNLPLIHKNRCSVCGKFGIRQYKDRIYCKEHLPPPDYEESDP